MKKEFIRRYGWTLLGIVAGIVENIILALCGLFHGNLPYHFFSCQQFHFGGRQWEDYCSVHLYRNVKK